MKKVIFSAVALVAFSFAGMANDGTVEECQKEYKAAKDKLIADGMNETKAALEAQKVYHACRSRSVSLEP
jgi:hypothetical protein